MGELSSVDLTSFSKFVTLPGRELLRGGYYERKTTQYSVGGNSAVTKFTKRPACEKDDPPLTNAAIPFTPRCQKSGG
jgi:hypothetical protein